MVAAERLKRIVVPPTHTNQRQLRPIMRPFQRKPVQPGGKPVVEQLGRWRQAERPVSPVSNVSSYPRSPIKWEWNIDLLAVSNQGPKYFPIPMARAKPISRLSGKLPGGSCQR